jgi:FkbM family methyltransferase
MSDDIVNFYTPWLRMKDAMIKSMPYDMLTGIVNTRYFFCGKYPHIKKEGNDYRIYWDNGYNLLSSTPNYFMDPNTFEKKYEQVLKIERGDIAVDVGACLGDTTIPMAIRTGVNGYVIAIEPSPKNLPYLRKNILGYPNISIIPKAVFNKKCVVPFAVHDTAMTGNRIDVKLAYTAMEKMPETSTTVDVEADTLDNVLEPYKRIDFLKIDVQWLEVEVLGGCTRLMQTTPKIVVETHGFDAVPLWSKVRDILVENGYSVKVTSDRIVHGWKDIDKHIRSISDKKENIIFKPIRHVDGD